MDMNFTILVAMGFLTSVVLAQFFQTVPAVVRRRVSEKPTRR